jgi:CO dehydrogenase maturation factor
MDNIAIAGKGGSGKTTIAGTLARILARRGHNVWAIDADSSPNLALTLGVPADRAAALVPMPRTLLEERTAQDGTRRMALAVPPADVAGRFGISTPDGVTLLLMGRVEHAGAG